MPKIEPVYEPRDHDMGAFDGGDDNANHEDGSRLPLLIVIGLLVLAAFGGVVWLAYQHGVERGMKDAPRQIAAQDTQAPSQNYDKIYQKPAPSDEDAANDDTAPPPPTLNPQATPPAASATAPAQTPATAKPVPSAATPAPQATAPAMTKPAPVVATPKPAKTVAATPVAPPPVPKTAQPQAVATKPPAKLVADTQAAPPPATAIPTEDVAPAPSTPAPSTPAPSTPAAASSGGEYVLQIGSYKSEDDAAASWRTYKAKHAIAASYGESTKKADLGDKGTWYRLRIGGFASKDAAAAFCAKLKADGGDCIPAKN